jgi:hypothetical protein
VTRQNGTATLHDDAYEWVTVEETARRISTSPSTIRRMIRDGTLTGELKDRSARDRRLRCPRSPNATIPDPCRSWDTTGALALHRCQVAGAYGSAGTRSLGALLLSQATPGMPPWSSRFEAERARAERLDAELSRELGRTWWDRLWGR